ncbi:MAG: RsmE family RNA methyltransferase [Alphaproteobacteria bacterium]
MKKIRIYIELNKSKFEAIDISQTQLELTKDNLTTNFLDQQVKIYKDDQHNHFNYLINVMRQKIASQIYIFDGKSGEFLSEIIAIDKKSLTLKILKKTCDFSQSSKITLAFALVKSNYLERIALQASELGVIKFQPLITQHSIIDKFNEQRFFANVKEACEQCERVDVPEIMAVAKLSDFLDKLDEKNQLLILADESSNSSDANEVLAKLKADDLFNKCQEIIVFVGPEGGYSSAEFKQFYSKKNLVNISLGKRILKVDTAIVASLALIQSYTKSISLNKIITKYF